MDVKKINLGWREVEDLAAGLIESMVEKDWTPTCVVGITRGGLVPATMISHMLGVPMCSLDVSLRDNDGPFGGKTTTWLPLEIENGHRFLVVDDINDTGATISWIRNDWKSTVQFMKPMGENWPWNHIKFATLVHNQPSPEASDFTGMVINKDVDPCWVIFPWESWFTTRI